MKNIYGKANKFKTKSDRLTIYLSNLLKLLKEGHRPFGPHCSSLDFIQFRMTEPTD